MKPLFVPLRAKYFNAFLDGSKDTEFRQYGPRWNEKTCVLGRDVTLSLGYGKGQRLRAKIIARAVFMNHSPEWLEVYGQAGNCIAIILEVER